MKRVALLATWLLLVTAVRAQGAAPPAAAEPPTAAEPPAESEPKAEAPEVSEPMIPVAIAPPSTPVETPPAAVPDGPGANEILRVAVFDIVVDDVPETAARVFGQTLAVELRKLRGVDVITTEEIATLLQLEANKQAMGCDEESSCLAEIADALGAQIVITGAIATVGDERAVGLSRIEQASASVTHRSQMRLAIENGEELLAAIGPAVAELFPDRELRPGETRGADPKLALLLNPPPVPAPIFWSSVAVTGGLVVATGTAAALNAGFAQDADSYKATANPFSITTYDDKAAVADLAAWTALGLAGASTVALAGSGVLYLFTNFNGGAE